MQFNDNIVTEITAPNNVPFQPGFNIIGFGSEVPPELVAEGLSAAIVFYTSDWNPAAVTPKVKFYFIAVNSTSVITGYAYSLNPSTTPTATVVRASAISINTAVGTALTQFTLRSGMDSDNLTNLIFRVVEGQATGGGVLTLYTVGGDPALNRYLQIQPASGANGCDIIFYDGTTGTSLMAWDGDNETLLFGTSTLGYGNWVACTYANGWSAVAGPSFGRRSGVAVFRDPVGTVHMTGVAQGGTTAVGTYCVQLPSSAYWPAFGKRFLVQCGNVENMATMSLDSGNGAITISGSFAATGETNFEATWTVLT